MEFSFFVHTQHSIFTISGSTLRSLFAGVPVANAMGQCMEVPAPNKHFEFIHRARFLIQTRATFNTNCAVVVVLVSCFESLGGCSRVTRLRYALVKLDSIFRNDVLYFLFMFVHTSSSPESSNTFFSPYFLLLFNLFAFIILGFSLRREEIYFVTANIRRLILMFQ